MINFLAILKRKNNRFRQNEDIYYKCFAMAHRINEYSARKDEKNGKEVYQTGYYRYDRG